MRSVHLLPGLAALVAGQVNPVQISASNSTGRTDSAPFPSISMRVTANNANATFALDSAFTRVPAGSSVQSHLRQPLLLNGRMQLTANASEATTLDAKAIGYVCCDADAYATANGLDELLNAAVEAMGNASNTSALVFYSRTASRCIVDAPGPFADTFNLFTLTNASAARDLETRLQPAGSGGALASITNSITGNATASAPSSATSSAASGDDSSDFMTGTSPGATVAMIVLYIITGLITLAFVSVIAMGAIRAHRHPEWYREDQEGGGGRRRVLGRAILDSIPIIKFGEAAPGGKTADGDAEMELEDGRQRPASTDPSMRERQLPEIVETVPRCPVHSTPTPLKEPEVTIAPAVSPAASETAEDEAPECAICVESFQQGDDMRVLPQCEHKFHPACLDPWLLNVSSTCPLCRLDLRPPTASQQQQQQAPASPGAETSADARASPDGEPEPVMWLVPTDEPGVYVQIDPRTIDEAHAGSRRPAASARLSHAWTRLLSRQRLRDASPQERVVALRELRRAANIVVVDEEAPDSEPGEPGVPRSSARVGDRLSRMFGRRPAFPASVSPSPPVSPISQRAPQLPPASFMRDGQREAEGEGECEGRQERDRET